MAYIIGVDIGTSGTKTVLFDEEGRVIASRTIEYPMYQPKTATPSRTPPTGQTPPSRPSRRSLPRAELRRRM